MNRWRIQEAKKLLYEIVRRAKSDAPQVITVHGKDAVVVLAASEFRKRSLRRNSLVEFFRKSPLVGSDLHPRRSGDTRHRVKGRTF